MKAILTILWTLSLLGAATASEQGDKAASDCCQAKAECCQPVESCCTETSAVPQTDQGSTVADSSEKTAAAYVCPMHPAITSDKPGKCSKCGMALVKKKA